MAEDTRFIQTVWQIMAELQNANQLESALSSGLDILCRTLKCRNGLIFVYDRKQDSIYALTSKGNFDIVGSGRKKEDDVIGKVIDEGTSLIVKDGKLPGYIKHESRNAAVIALKSLRNVIGCIVLMDKDGKFDEEDIKLCDNCAALIAIDLEDKGLTFTAEKDRPALVSLRNVIKEFKNGDEMRRILKGIDLDVYEGELLVVLGESGCGKSTMLNIIGGMDQLTDGQLLIEGKDFSHPSENELTDYRRDYIGYIFQAYNLMPNLTALENVEFIAEISKHPFDAKETLEMVGLGDKADRYPSVMSGGQQQRVCIARAIVKDPKIILADEPTAALDFQTGQGILKAIEKIVDEKHTTVIMVTHNIEIAKMADRVISLKDGVISNIRVNLNPLKAEELSW